MADARVQYSRIELIMFLPSPKPCVTVIAETWQDSLTHDATIALRGHADLRIDGSCSMSGKTCGGKHELSDEGK